MLISRSCAVILLAVVPGVAGADEASDARANASQMIQQLGTALKKELAANGPEGAISVCRDLGPAIAGEMSRKSGARITRVSLKTRNPMLGNADAWEQQVLADFDRKAAAGQRIEAMEYSETVDEPAGRYFRYMKAIPVQPACLSCHGTSENLPDSVKATLAAEYPDDRATGYALGQVRGAVTVKQKIEGAR